MIYRDKDPEPFRATVVDIGLGGVQLRSTTKLPVEEKLTLHIGQDDAQPLHLHGMVRYSNLTDGGSFASGFKFLPESHQERVMIAEFVHSVFQRQWELLAS